ncbi:MAG: DUF4143 domain-containing protein, partial [Candidatus Marinimicrobia bacterium]|nr:DUF4143 domain-containing protein [Candidatus Neomarinimicrobiota bacterium]
DTGILHSLLGLSSFADLERHPKIGASWEGFVLGELIQQLGIGPDDAYFWATHSGAELDLLVFKGGKPIGFEVKRSTNPKITPSMRISFADLNLEHLFVIHAGDHEFLLAENMTAIPLSGITRVKEWFHAEAERAYGI